MKWLAMLGAAVVLTACNPAARCKVSADCSGAGVCSGGFCTDLTTVSQGSGAGETSDQDDPDAGLAPPPDAGSSVYMGPRPFSDGGDGRP